MHTYTHRFIHTYIHTHTYLLTFIHTYIILLYVAPVWIGALEKECNTTVYNIIQRLINIKLAKAFRITSNKALCTLTGLTPIVIKAEEAATLYNLMRKSQVHNIDHEVHPKARLHSADSE